ncbi:MAG: hypothetical protein KDE53_07690 [Caldilineaceae bacterium]|nr:hypothetical protein [Caldilineaceae bacterium]
MKNQTIDQIPHKRIAWRPINLIGFGSIIIIGFAAIITEIITTFSSQEVIIEDSI